MLPPCISCYFTAPSCTCRTKTLNPHAAPFVPRAPLPASRTFLGYSALKSTLSAEGSLEGQTAPAAVAVADAPHAPAGPSTATEGAKEIASTSPLQTLEAFEGSRVGPQGSPKHPPGAAQCAGKQQRCKKSSSATMQRAPLVAIPGYSWDAFPSLQEEESRQQQQNKHHQKQHQVLQGTPWRPRSQSAPARSAAPAKAVVEAFPRKCQYSPSVMLGLRRQSLLLQPPYKAFNLMLQQQQLQRSQDEPSIPFSPSASPATGGVAIPPAFSSPVLGTAVAPCFPRRPHHDFLFAPPPPPLPRRQEGPLQHRRGPQEQPKRTQQSGCVGSSWDGFANAGPLLPLPRVTPSGPPLLPTPRGPPIAAGPFQQLDQCGLLTGYWGSTGPGTTGPATKTGVPWVPGSLGALGGSAVRPLLCLPMEHDGSRAPVHTTMLQQRDLMRQHLHNHLQHELLLQGVPSAAFPESPVPTNPESVRRVTRTTKSPRKGLSCPQQRRQKQSQQNQQQQQVHNQSASNKSTPDHRNDPYARALPLSNEAALQKLLGMVTSLLMSRSGCKELRQQQQ